MRTNLVLARFGKILAATTAAAALALPTTGGAQGGGATVTITVSDLRSAKGVVRACMTTNEDVFPRCIKDPASHRTVVDAKPGLVLTFRNVKPGRYAIALLHDENNNGKADRALGMMPKEGFGFSRDAKVRMGPPKYSDAVFDVGGSAVRQRIRMRYML